MVLGCLMWIIVELLFATFIHFLVRPSTWHFCDFLYAFWSLVFIIVKNKALSLSIILHYLPIKKIYYFDNWVYFWLFERNYMCIWIFLWLCLLLTDTFSIVPFYFFLLWETMIKIAFLLSGYFVQFLRFVLYWDMFLFILHGFKCWLIYLQVILVQFLFWTLYWKLSISFVL